MARAAKKETVLTPEEKLAQALVPEEDQPYQVPENWCWVTLGGITQVIGGGTPSSGNPDYYEGGNIPWISPADLSNYDDMFISNGAKSITELGLAKSSARMLPKGTVCLSSRAPIGYVVIAANPLSTNQGFKSFLPSPSYVPQYLYWYLKGNKELLESRASGTTFLELSGSKAATIECPLAPLAEQQRIVDRIESLFAKLDEAKEKAQAVVDEYDGIRQAFLYQAFYGNLTAKWREKQGIQKEESWEIKTLQSVCVMKITDGTHKTPTYCDSDTGIPFVSSKDVTSGMICWDNIKYIVPELHEELYERLAPQVDDVLLAKNGTTGVAAIVEEEKVFDLYVTLAVLRPNKEIIDPRYLLNVVNSPICKRQFDEHLTGIGVPNLHLRDIKEVEIPLPSLAEQKEIARIIDAMSEKWNEAKASAEKVIDRVDTMKKSILARAFRGELGTNDPADESAEELLKRIL